MGKKGSVRQVLKARGVISHHVVWSWEEETFMAIAVEALVVAGVVAQVGGRPSPVDCSFGDSGEGRSVVGAIGEGSIAHVMGHRHEGDLA